jgi:hypothetical protein
MVGKLSMEGHMVNILGLSLVQLTQLSHFHIKTTTENVRDKHGCVSIKFCLQKQVTGLPEA